MLKLQFVYGLNVHVDGFLQEGDSSYNHRQSSLRFTLIVGQIKCAKCSVEIPLGLLLLLLLFPADIVNICPTIPLLNNGIVKKRLDYSPNYLSTIRHKT